MTLPVEFLADFPRNTSLLVIIGPDTEQIAATKDLLFDRIDWEVTSDLRAASEMIAARVDQTPVDADPSYWYDKNLTVDVGVIDTRPDPITLLALSHVQDKGYEVAVSGVLGLIWDDEHLSPEVRSGRTDLFGQILGSALLLDAEQVALLMTPS